MCVPHLKTKAWQCITNADFPISVRSRSPQLLFTLWNKRSKGKKLEQTWKRINKDGFGMIGHYFSPDQKQYSTTAKWVLKRRVSMVRQYFLFLRVVFGQYKVNRNIMIVILSAVPSAKKTVKICWCILVLNWWCFRHCMCWRQTHSGGSFRHMRCLAGL